MIDAHTPGPWESAKFTRPDGAEITTVGDVAETVAFSARAGDRPELFGVCLQQPTDTGRHVVVCYTGNGPNAHNNARLIAAAPDLLAACVGMAERLEEYAAELDRDKTRGEANNVGTIAATLRAAAAKATG